MNAQNQHKYLEERVADLENKVADLESAINADQKLVQSESLSVNEIKETAKSILEDHFKLQLHNKNTKNGVGFQTEKMEKYLPRNSRQTYHFWVAVGIGYLRCCLTIYPQNHDQSIISKMNKIMQYFGKEDVTNKSRSPEAFSIRRDIDNPTSSVISETIKNIVKEAIEKTDTFLDKISAECRKRKL